MKVFHCDHCQGLVFFENVRCLTCGHALAFLPDVADVGSLEKAGNGKWRTVAQAAQRREYRLCRNYDRENVCNWAVPADDGHEYCASCRLTRVIPDLTVGGNKEAWYKLEVAKRRLMYSLLTLRLPIRNKEEDPQRGLAFEFKADTAQTRVLMGHEDGVIVINIAETDDAEREWTRNQLHEPYRTLLGHFRHESGHYYWDRLIKYGPRLADFRRLFADERQDYHQALQIHYGRGAPPDWPQWFVTGYASAHPWEDFAETWAHYLHMADALETAAACGLMLRPLRRDEPKLTGYTDGQAAADFDRMVTDWRTLTYVLNNLNRGMGLPDAYPFALSDGAVGKLRFVHETIRGAGQG